MNWEAIGAIGESLGAIAVFITLGYLALQVQFARKEIGRSISQTRAEALRTVTLARANDLPAAVNPIGNGQTLPAR